MHSCNTHTPVHSDTQAVRHTAQGHTHESSHTVTWFCSTHRYTQAHTGTHRHTQVHTGTHRYTNTWPALWRNESIWKRWNSCSDNRFSLVPGGRITPHSSCFLLPPFALSPPISLFLRWSLPLKLNQPPCVCVCVCVCVLSWDAARLACQTACIAFVTYFGSQCVFFMSRGDADALRANGVAYVTSSHTHTHTYTYTHTLQSSTHTYTDVFYVKQHLHIHTFYLFICICGATMDGGWRGCSPGNKKRLKLRK